MSRNTGHKLAAGTLTVVAMGSEPEIKAWTKQSDQSAAIPWTSPETTFDAPRRPRFSVMADGSKRSDGFYAWQWAFSFWTHDMLGYVLTTFFPNDEASVAVTVLAYDATDTAVYLTATLDNPVASGGLIALRGAGGYSNVVLNFTMGTVIT